MTILNVMSKSKIYENLYGIRKFIFIELISAELIYNPSTKCIS